MCTLSISAHAVWDGYERGKIVRVDVTGATNYGFRIWLEGHPKMCANIDPSNTANWAYLNETDSNYQIYISVLLSAKAMGKDVTVYTKKGSNGYCKIGYISN